MSEYKDFDLLKEQIDNILNTNALIILLYGKGLITIDEFFKAKDQAAKDFEKQFPQLIRVE